MLCRGLTLSLFVLVVSLAHAADGVFAKDNLVAWCIVPFDAKSRTPVERAEMLKRLGFERFAYDWRAKDIPSFDEEADALAKYGVELHAFWLISGPDPANQTDVKQVLNFLARRSPGTEIWYMFDPPAGFDSLAQQKKVEVTAGAVRYIAEAAEKFGSKVGLYNHGGWFGEPENQIAVIKNLDLKNVGIVYNFHHARHHIHEFPRLFALMEPYLLAVNLNGMRESGPSILPLGEGEHELAMMRLIQESAYRGPIGILHLRPELDAEQGLKQNLEGMVQLLRKLPDESALRTYRQ